MQKIVILLVLLILPIFVQADKYDDVNSSLRDILIALGQVSIQGKDSANFAQIQQAIVKTSRDITALQSEYKATQDEVMACKNPSPSVTPAESSK